MDQAAVLKIIDRFRISLENRGVKAERIILFGSHASGRPREDSDIDLVVISDDFNGLDYWQRIDLLSEAIYQVLKPIEAMAVTGEEWEKGDSYILELARKGKTVFAA